MRIIRGKHQRRQITAPSNLPVRPTTDMAKESLFNILENHVDFEDIIVLDLFAGTGNISYELVSRGCPRVTAVDENNNCIKFIRETATKLNMEELVAIRSDVFRFIPMHKVKYDLIFADPPYTLKELPEIPNMVFEHDLLKEGGIFIFEHGKDYDFSDHPKFMRHIAYGSVNFTIFKSR